MPEVILEHIKVDDKTKQAIEAVLSKGERAVCIPTKNGGIRVNIETEKTVYLQK